MMAMKKFPGVPLAYSGKGFVTTELQRQLHLRTL
jgi:hypothetical protein